MSHYANIHLRVYPVDPDLKTGKPRYDVYSIKMTECFYEPDWPNEGDICHAIESGDEELPVEAAAVTAGDQVAVLTAEVHIDWDEDLWGTPDAWFWLENVKMVGTETIDMGAPSGEAAALATTKAKTGA